MDDLNQQLADFHLKTLLPDDSYFSDRPVKNTALLFPDFFVKVQAAVAEWNETYPNIEVVFVETYRSNTLQMAYFNNGASKIKTNGMHHYGIGVDCAFNVNGEFTYQGDYELLRKCFEAQELHLLGSWDIGHVQMIPATLNDQQALRNTVTAAIKDFQRSNGLVVDGIPGPKTQAKAKELNDAGASGV